MTSEFKFIRPLEAPVFCPTEEEFEDPIAYVNKIRPFAEKAGICKIRPPTKFQPPFAVDVDNFKFVPRIQRINECEAKTRVKLNFLDRIAKFWELQGTSLKIPLIDKKPLDLHKLHELVQKEGGRDKINSEKKWNWIASRIGYDRSRSLGDCIQQHYEKFLYPFDVFEATKIKHAESNVNKSEAGTSKMKAPSRMSGGPKSSYEDKSKSLSTTPKELKRLAFYGAGPKMAGFNSTSSQNLSLRTISSPHDSSSATSTSSSSSSPHPIKSKGHSSLDPLSKYMCRICGKGDAEDNMLLCDGCDDSYHTFCLDPPLVEIPQGEWRCPKCVADEVSKPSEAFGFEQATREYSLQQFGEMADQFKSEYFNMPVHLVPSEQVEREFWRIVSAIDEDVQVEYGADLHTMDHGSGFPTTSTKDDPRWCSTDERYIRSGWNLNNLPILPGSVLGHINTDISGMMVPWMYVGMCFSTFCWHNEDHWSYSINYLHWGEPKTWYGVPGGRADDFESAMKQAAPELFHSQPDLLHQLVTIMNPNILMAAGVPVYRMDQKAGEFIVTFPRAYHAGFNQGYNFAEAVNFAPADWLQMGRSCIEHYSTLHRYCVFSHDELVCKMTAKADKLDLNIAVATYKDMLKMYENEKENRRLVSSWGVSKCERVAFELVTDDAKLCDYCKTTCFLSAIICSCPDSASRLVCLKHYQHLCDCPPKNHTLQYRYTLDEIPEMMLKLKDRVDDFEQWNDSLRAGLKLTPGNKIDLEELSELIDEGVKKKFPNSSLFESAVLARDRAIKVSTVAKELVKPSVRTRNRNAEEKLKISASELELFVSEINSLSVNIVEAPAVRLMLEKTTAFRTRAISLMEAKNPKIDELKSCLALGLEIDVDAPEIELLKTVLERVKWTQSVVGSLSKNGHNWTVDFLLKTIESGECLAKHAEVEDLLRKLRKIHADYLEFENKAKKIIESKDKVRVDEIETLVRESSGLEVSVPSLIPIRDLLRRCNEWMRTVHSSLSSSTSTSSTSSSSSSSQLFLDEMIELVERGRGIGIQLPEVGTLVRHIAKGKEFRASLAAAFLRTHSLFTLMEVFVPRTEVNSIAKRAKVVPFDPDEVFTRDNFAKLLGVSSKELSDTHSVLKRLQEMERVEIRKMSSLRNTNFLKKSQDDGSSRYCVCHSLFDSGLMIRCNLCLEFFHSTCVPLKKHAKIDGGGGGGGGGGVSNLAVSAYLIKTGSLSYSCPSCAKSRRPPLTSIIDLLSLLQLQTVRVPEGECLEYLCRRAMAWLDSARDFLSNKEIERAVGLTTPLGYLPTSSLPPPLRSEYSIGSEWVGVWRRGSGATLNPETPGLDLSPLVIGERGEEEWRRWSSSVFGPPVSIRSWEACPPYGFNGGGGGGVGGEKLTQDEIETASALMSLSSPNNTFFPNTQQTPSFVGLGSNVKSEPQWEIEGDDGCSSENVSERKEIVLRPLEPPKLNLSGSLLMKLDTLLLEGYLLETTCDEIKILAKLKEFSSPPPPYITLSMAQESIEAEILLKGLHKDDKKVGSEEESRIGRKSRGKSSTGGGGGGVIKSKTKVEKRGKSEGSSGRKSTQPTPPPPKKRKSSGESSMNKKRQSAKKKKTVESCAVPKCKQPAGSEIDWIQCEHGCEQWFHWICVGLTAADINKIKRYCCGTCTQPPLIIPQEVDADGKNKENNSISSNNLTTTPSSTTSTQEKV